MRTRLPYQRVLLRRRLFAELAEYVPWDVNSMWSAYVNPFKWLKQSIFQAYLILLDQLNRYGCWINIENVWWETLYAGKRPPPPLIVFGCIIPWWRSRVTSCQWKSLGLGVTILSDIIRVQKIVLAAGIIVFSTYYCLGDWHDLKRVTIRI